MANRTMHVTKPLRYRTRMLQAGDQIELDGPKARLFQALGVVEEGASDAAPKKTSPRAARSKRKAPKAK